MQDTKSASAEPPSREGMRSLLTGELPSKEKLASDEKTAPALAIEAQLDSWGFPGMSWATADSRTALDPLYKDEEDAIARAVERRRWDFSAGRHCARAALKHLGVEAVAIPVGKHRAPCFPRHVVGSISHARIPEPVAVAIAAPADALDGLGIDIEVAQGTARLDPLLIGTPSELRRAAARAGAGVHVDVLFSIKESAYKALHASLRRILEFTELEVDLEGDSFSCWVRAAAHWRVVGRWAASPQFTIAVSTFKTA